jgi:alpha-L-fucosidase
MPTGEIEPRQVAVLKEVGIWLKSYGESIYGTRGGPYRNGGWGGSTRRGNIVYLHILKWSDDRLTLPPLPAKIKKSRALNGGTVKVAGTADGITVSMVRAERDTLDTIVRLELDRPLGRMEALEVRD